MSGDKKVSGAALDFKLIGRIVKQARPHSKLFTASVLLTLLITALSPIRPMLVQYAMDNPIANKNLSALYVVCGYILLHILVQSFSIYFHTYTVNLLAQSVIKDLRMKVYNHLLSLNRSFFDRSKVGTLVTRSVSDVETVSAFFSQGLISIIGDVAQLLVILGVMIYMSWKLTLISLAVLPILLIASEFFRRGVRKSFQSVRTQVSKLNAFVQEQIVGMEVVQLFGKRNQEYKKFEEINRGHLDAYKKSIFYYSIYFPIVEILSSVSLGLIIWYAAASEGSTTTGEIIAFVMFIGMIFRPLRTIADRFNQMQMGMVGSERIFALLDDKKPIEDQGSKDVAIKGNIEFKNVWFAYTGDDYVLKDLNFSLQEGNSLAIVGATGAGKSSIVNLITRGYEIQKGEILVDGNNIKQLSLSSLRKQISVVLQDVFLFAGSVADNVSLRQADINQDKIKEAASSIGALEFLESLPSGLDYNVMERGGALSVGQRQLISFIRAIAADPRVLILDEATSSVDTETEELLQRATEHLMQNRTSIAIAHRLSTVRQADHILVLDKGRILEEGNHSELMAKKAHYYQLFQKQFELV